MTIQTDEIILSKGFCMPSFECDTSVTVGDGKVGFSVPAEMNGMNLKSVLVSVGNAKGITGTTEVQIRRKRAGSDVDMLSTKITVGDEWHASDGVINTANDDLQTGDVLYADIDQIHSGTAPLGLSVVCMAKKP